MRETGRADRLRALQKKASDHQWSNLYIPLDFLSRENPTVLVRGDRSGMASVSRTHLMGSVAIGSVGHGDATVEAEDLKDAIDLVNTWPEDDTYAEEGDDVSS